MYAFILLFVATVVALPFGGQHVPVNGTIAVRLARNADPSTVAADIGMVYLGTIANLEGYHLYTVSDETQERFNHPEAFFPDDAPQTSMLMPFFPGSRNKTSSRVHNKEKHYISHAARAVLERNRESFKRALIEVYPKVRKSNESRKRSTSETIDNPIMWYDIQVPTMRDKRMGRMPYDNSMHVVHVPQGKTPKVQSLPLIWDRRIDTMDGTTNAERTIDAVDIANTVMADFEDPLYVSQWHLTIMQTKDAWKVSEAYWKSRKTDVLSGILVVDDGVDSRHPDLADNFSPNNKRSWDYNGGGGTTPNPSPGDGHGTSAAGVAAAVANKVCGVGVAFHSSLAGVRLIAVPVGDAVEASGVTHGIDNGNDVVSCSWGPRDDGQRLEGPGPLTEMAMHNAVLKTGRNGRGTIYSWASGNGRAEHDSCSYDGYASSRYVISVGAVGSDGRIAWYSEGCPSLMVVAPSSSRRTLRAVSTTAARFGSSDASCTTSFGGTSAAAPMVAGVSALILTANPTLTWRDVQHALVHTSSRPPYDDDYMEWKANGAGLRHSDSFGFGIVNASAAVRYVVAPEWKHAAQLLTWESSVIRVNIPVPDGTGQSVLSQIDIPSTIAGRYDTVEPTSNRHPTEMRLSSIEWVEVEFVATSARRGDLTIKLTSPMGTDSMLAGQHGDKGRDYDWKFSSCKHWGERPDGKWTLAVADTVQFYKSVFISCTYFYWGRDKH